jgi:trehalose 6-phosphate phosphatase
VKRLLGREGRAALAGCLDRDPVLAFDFDGTLAPIVDVPGRARMRARTRKLLTNLAGERPCVVISGRALPDLSPRLEGIELACRVGNHGSSWDPPRPTDVRERHRVRSWRRDLEDALDGQAGLFVEDNGVSLAVHYRRARDQTAARRKVDAAVATLAGARLVEGKCVVNVLPEEAPHKGDALAAICRRLERRAALYVGDDVTDEDVFTTRVAPRFLTVRVGRSGRSAAGWYLRDQAEIDELLTVLVELVHAT